MKFYRRAPVRGVPPFFLQDGESFICRGRALHIFYPGINEWFDIYDKVGERGLERPLMTLERISIYTFIKETGWPGIIRLSNTLFGTRCFVKRPKVKENKECTKYENTEDFFSSGPGVYEDMRPPVIIGDNPDGE